MIYLVCAVSGDGGAEKYQCAYGANQVNPALGFKHFATRAHSVSLISVPCNTYVGLTNITSDACDCVCTISQLQLLHGSVLDMVLRFESPGFLDIASYRRQLDRVVP